MKVAEEAMEILEPFDLTRSLRDAAELAGCSPSTVARYVELREVGVLRVETVRRQQLLDEYREKVEEMLLWSVKPSDEIGCGTRLWGVFSRRGVLW